MRKTGGTEVATTIRVLTAVLLLAGCTHPLRTVYIDATVSAYDVIPAQGQDPAQTQADIAACRQKLIDEPGDLEPYAFSDPVVVGADVERAKRYTGCLRERGYTAEQRPMR